MRLHYSIFNRLKMSRIMLKYLLKVVSYFFGIYYKTISNYNQSNILVHAWDKCGKRGDSHLFNTNRHFTFPEIHAKGTSHSAGQNLVVPIIELVKLVHLKHCHDLHTHHPWRISLIMKSQK